MFVLVCAWFWWVNIKNVGRSTYVFELLYKLLPKMVKLYTNIQKNISIICINVNNSPTNPWVKLKFSFCCGDTSWECLQWKSEVLVVCLLPKGLAFFFLLLVDLDDTEKNEKLKFSIVTRLPEVPLDVISWNLGVLQNSSLCIGSSQQKS